VEIGGIDQMVKVAHLRLCYSRAFFLTAYPRESQAMVFDAHARAFAHRGAILRRGIYDNMKTAIDAIVVGKERRYNRRFLAMCNHYLIEPTACTPACDAFHERICRVTSTALVHFERNRYSVVFLHNAGKAPDLHHQTQCTLRIKKLTAIGVCVSQSHSP